MPRERQEARIRDHLAAHLGLIEEGLTLIKTEYMLRNSIGAKGFIDILAKDPIGHLVVIEVKRDDTAARTAIQELFKYTELFLQQEGLGPEKVRAILVSTHWHELRVPFSAFARRAEFSVYGVSIELDSAGLPVRGERVATDAPKGPRRFSPHHLVYLFENATKRESALPSLRRAIASASITDYVVIELDYGGSSPNVIHPFGLYLAIDTFPPQQRSKLEVLAQGTEDFDTEDRWWLEEWALSQVALRGYDSCEASYPNKLTATIEEGWEARAVQRKGITARSQLTVSDADVLSELKGLAGDNSVLYVRAGKPDVAPSWRALRSGLEEFLDYRPSWAAAYRLLFEKVEAEHPGARVLVRAYDQNPLIGFLKLAQDHTEEFLPDAEFLAASDTSDVLVQGCGFLDWDGSAPNPSELKELAIHPPWGLTGRMGADAVLNAWGLRYGFAYTTVRSGSQLTPWSFLERSSGGWAFTERENVQPMQTLSRFLQSHGDVVAQAVERLQRVYHEV